MRVEASAFPPQEFDCGCDYSVLRLANLQLHKGGNVRSEVEETKKKKIIQFFFLDNNPQKRYEGRRGEGGLNCHVCRTRAGNSRSELGSFSSRNCFSLNGSSLLFDNSEFTAEKKTANTIWW